MLVVATTFRYNKGTISVGGEFVFTKYKKFKEKRPYANVILIMIFTSFIGILIEYIVNKDFIGSGLYPAIAFTLIGVLRVKRRNKTKQDL